MPRGRYWRRADLDAEGRARCPCRLEAVAACYICHRCSLRAALARATCNNADYRFTDRNRNGGRGKSSEDWAAIAICFAIPFDALDGPDRPDDATTDDLSSGKRARFACGC